MKYSLRQHFGIARSLFIYHGIPFRQRRLRRFYAQFIKAGDLCFDIGAHLGNRTRAWLALGAKVVAVEPQPSCMQFLQRCYGKHAEVMLIDQAIAATSGKQTLLVSQRTPTVTTLSNDWSKHVQQTVDSFADVVWDTEIDVYVTTLDALIQRFGEPVFCKLDIEGFEAEALRGLKQPLPALSFEYLPGAKSISLACLEQLTQLGRYEFNWAPGESLQLQAAPWLTVQQITAVIEAMHPQANSGDIYARQLSA